jgi:hypothetical protein
MWPTPWELGLGILNWSRTHIQLEFLNYAEYFAFFNSATLVTSYILPVSPYNITPFNSTRWQVIFSIPGVLVSLPTPGQNQR